MHGIVNDPRRSVGLPSRPICGAPGFSNPAPSKRLHHYYPVPAQGDSPVFRLLLKETVLGERVP